MKLFTGWIMSAGLVMAAGAANAQVLAPYEVGRSPYRVVSDFGGPYAAMPRGSASRLWPGYGPRLLPPHEVYTVLRESGFSPLGIPGAARPRLHDFGDRSRRRRRAAGDRRPHRADPALPAGQPDGRQFRRCADDHLRPARSAAAGRRDAGRAAPAAAAPKVASRTPGVPVPKPRAGEARPLAATTPAVRPAQPAAVPPTPAVGCGGAGKTGRSADHRPLPPRCGSRRRGQARAADPADPGHAEGAGTGVGRPSFRGAQARTRNLSIPGSTLRVAPE